MINYKYILDAKYEMQLFLGEYDFIKYPLGKADGGFERIFCVIYCFLLLYYYYGSLTVVKSNEKTLINQ